jgi:hypothetical protein
VTTSSPNIPEPPAEPAPFKGNGDGWVGNFNGDNLAGEVTLRDTIETDKFGGRVAPLLKVRDHETDEEVDVPCWRAHLAQLVDEHDVQVGDLVSITYFGQEPGGLRQLYGMAVTKADG